jgi:ribosome-binding protein aMBF1 (putative translation factor)
MGGPCSNPRHLVDESRAKNLARSRRSKGDEPRPETPYKTLLPLTDRQCRMILLYKKKAGLSIAQIAKAAGIGQAVYQRFEDATSHKRGVRYESLKRILKIIDLPIDTLKLKDHQIKDVIK